MKCTFIKSDNQPCQAQAMNGSEFCFRHDPNSKELQLVASSKGGANRKLFKSYGEKIEIKSPKDVMELIGLTISGVWSGEIPAGQPANTIGFLSRCYLDVYEKTEIEERISKLEEKIEEIK